MCERKMKQVVKAEKNLQDQRRRGKRLPVDNGISSSSDVLVDQALIVFLQVFDLGWVVRL